MCLFGAPDQSLNVNVGCCAISGPPLCCALRLLWGLDKMEAVKFFLQMELTVMVTLRTTVV